MSWEDSNISKKDVAKTGIKLWMWFIIALVAISVLGFVGKIILFPAKVAQNAADTAYGVVDKTLNADNALFNYENFHNMYQGAKQQVVNIKNNEKSLNSLKETFGEDTSKWSKDTRQEYYHIKQTIDGYKMQYESIVSRYNADSQKFNRNLFKDKDLPYELPLDYNQLK